MSIFSRLFSSRTVSVANQSEQNLEVSPKIGVLGLSFTENFLEISDIDFFGQYEKSKNGEWVIAWRDFDPSQERSGNRKSGLGHYILINIKNSSIVFQGKMERPNCGHVSDVGIFSMEDWHFGDELSGSFNVFSSEGKQIINRKVQANIYNSGISEDGKFALFQTANAQTEDGNSLIAFETDSGSELFSINPKTGWAYKYRFKSIPPTFIVCHKELGEFRYDEHGTFLDSDKFQEARLKSKQYDVALMAVDDLLKMEIVSCEDVKMGLEVILAARSYGADNDKGWKPIALKLQGQANQLLGNADAALQAYEEALSLNPKIGVKQKISSLRKQIQNNGIDI